MRPAAGAAWASRSDSASARGTCPKRGRGWSNDAGNDRSGAERASAGGARHAHEAHNDRAESRGA
eukprot:12937227-Prorocentrum_lima.AAC.1